EQLRDDERAAGRAADVVHRDDVGMADEGGGPRLVEETREAGVVGRQRARENLHCHRTIEMMGIVCPVDVAGTARCQQTLYFVPSKPEAVEPSHPHTVPNAEREPHEQLRQLSDKTVELVRLVSFGRYSRWICLLPRAASPPESEPLSQ